MTLSAENRPAINLAALLAAGCLLACVLDYPVGQSPGTASTAGTLSAGPAPDLGAFTPGLVVMLESYQQSPPDLDRIRVSADGGVLLFARTGHGSLHADDWSPLQFSDEAFCDPSESDDCGYEFARYMFSAATPGGEPVVLHDGSHADVGEYQVWVPTAIEVATEGNLCADAYPGRWTIAMLRRP
ncbi:hypothetical protein OV203_34210 [Nannocystis sp. ILAH1]|uniref:hypothetical protein n=1 Tax=unclassified Nannocystis TaxID=2627009 RepID=UPI00227080FF|nr:MULTISPECIES: hypothetical protein [unclassified Nannocystis]MCY0992242.1 hypothetical protein [Nannocystis sp. ILAH1]MCY1069170.1 hypothetical protein [Nannocystis sp. RBIL2]